MPTAAKEKVVQQFEKDVREAKGVVVTQCQGLKTAEFNELRAKLRPLKGECRVVKNTLTRLALKNAGWSALGDTLEGPTAVMIQRGDPLATTKLIFEFAKSHENLKIRAGMMDGQILSGQQLRQLASLPPREVLLSQLLGALQGPLVQLLNVLQAPVRELVGVLDAVAKKSPQK